jgi:glycosyltransferase involved in cell wall biosynthesis
MNHYDLVHVNTSLGVNNLYRDPWFVLISKVFGKKVLVFFHGWKPESIIGVRHRFFKLLISCDAVVVLAKEFELQLRDWGYKGQIYLETTVVSREVECLLAGATTRELKGVIKILFLSRIEIAKGIYEAVKAFQIIKKRTDFDIQLVIAGDGTELSGVQDYIRRHEISNVRFCGFVSGTEKSKVLLDSDIYILPSYSEGMPISVL